MCLQDPCVDKYTDDKYDNEEWDDSLQMALTYNNPDDTASAVRVPDSRSSATKKRGRIDNSTDSESRKVQKVGEASGADELDGMRAALQQLLGEAGDNKSYLESVQPLNDSADDFCAQVRNAECGRVCLAQPYAHVVHGSTSNNARLFLKRQDSDHYNVRYHCFSDRCNKHDVISLGTISKVGSNNWGVHCKVAPRRRREGDEPMVDAPELAGAEPGVEVADGDPSTDTYKDDCSLSTISKVGSNNWGAHCKVAPRRRQEGDEPMEDAKMRPSAGDKPRVDAPEPAGAEPGVEVADGDPSTDTYKDNCFREVLLTAPMVWDAPETELLMRLYKSVNPNDGRGALAEWFRRNQEWGSENDFEQRFDTTQPLPLKSGVWTKLHQLRMDHPVLTFSERTRYALGLYVSLGSRPLALTYWLGPRI
jgi:hypothetical protein